MAIPFFYFIFYEYLHYTQELWTFVHGKLTTVLLNRLRNFFFFFGIRIDFVEVET
jgi:hypothetical protein